MSDNSPLPARHWTGSRYGLAAFNWLSLLLVWFVLRLVLYVAFRPASLSFFEVLLAFLNGFVRDCLVAIWLTLPWLAVILVTPERWLAARSFRFLFWSAALVFWTVEIFLLFVEYFFFEEFKSRFNTVAVDYLQYPHEVFTNIWESYHVGIVVTVCVVLALAWVLFARRLFSNLGERPSATRLPFQWSAALASVALALAPLLITLAAIAGWLSPPVHPKPAHISDDRTLNEIADNGVLSFFAAAWTHHLDYAGFYKTLDSDEAYRRVRRLLSEPNSRFLQEGHSIRRQVAGDPARARLNVVLFLEESLGSEFWGCLGRSSTLTPEMDKLALQDGLLFTNIYASGNRTVRGFEGVLSSFPPLPGDSIVKRELSANVETVARVLKRDGYSTLFLYGGRGLFDGMRSFAVHNGYDRFVEQKHFEHPTFSTIWGVCDEDLFEKAIEEMRVLARGDKPFLSTILSVSNHKPFTYPKGRIPEDPDRKKRENAVKYSDYCLGKFFREAKQEPFWTNTIFVVVADHGARVYGRQSIPIHSYEIPLVILGPAVVKSPQQLPQLGCSLDVTPTLLGLLGRPYETLFFGRDLLHSPSEGGRVTLNHNRDIGMLTGDRLVVLGLMKTVEFYGGDPKQVEMGLLAQAGERERELEKDTIALYQVADDLYTHERYSIDGEPAAKTSTSNDRTSKTMAPE